MMAGANPAAVKRIMRHSDPKLTTEVYGHLAPEYLRAEVDRLSFGPQPTEPNAATEELAEVANGSIPSSSGAPVVQTAGRPGFNPSRPPGNQQRTQEVTSARDTGFEPVAFGSGGD